MSKNNLAFIILSSYLLLNYLVASGSASCCPNYLAQRINQEFEQKTNRFFQFHEQSNSWVEVELPYDLFSCINENCTIVGSIQPASKSREEQVQDDHKLRGNLRTEEDDVRERVKENYKMVLPRRNRVCLTKMSESSIWVVGESGSIYERFWNGVHWVIAPHDLPASAGPAVSVFFVKQMILALSEAGYIYQMQLAENSQPVWVELPVVNYISNKEAEQSSVIKIKSGVVTHDGERIYFCTKNGSLLDLAELEPPRWVNHGPPPNADVAAIADTGTIRAETLFTISSAGELYEHDKNTKPPWKKHIWKGESAEQNSLIPSKGCSLQGLDGAYSASLFLITKAGTLVERRLQQRKWKWIRHGSPKNQLLTSITPTTHDESNEKTGSLLLTTASGSIFEYQITKTAGMSQERQIPGAWINHTHPPHAKAATGVAALPYQFGRILFPLDDGRIAELHLSGIGGENTGPNHQVNIRRKVLQNYLWSILDAPETEGWNAEYCTEERGPKNCIIGTKDEAHNLGSIRPMTRRRKGHTQLSYLIPDAADSNAGKSSQEHKFTDKWINTNFRLRVMQEGGSFFLVHDAGMIFEYIHNNNVGLWLRHEHPIFMQGAVGSYNGSLFLVDVYGSLMIRERGNDELGWINCTAMKKGREIIGGPPWDRIPGTVKITAEDTLFFVGRNGRLFQFSVAHRRFKWKDCKNPAGTRIASIVDQEVFRNNIVFVVGRNGQFYQYNIVTGFWHQHYQSQHLILSSLPGTAMRPSALSLKGSLFMISEQSGLVEYHWNSIDGWAWVEHGRPNGDVNLISAPGPSFEGNQLFLIGSDGQVYLRYFDQTEWRWKNFGFPEIENAAAEEQAQVQPNGQKEGICLNGDTAADLQDRGHLDHSNADKYCDSKVASMRPIRFAEDSVIFELRDGRLAEIRRIQVFDWAWSQIIATPTSSCMANYWTAVASDWG